MFALASMSDMTVLIIALATLTAAYNFIRIFSSWMDGSLMHLQASRTRPSSSLAWSHSPQPTTTSGSLVLECTAFFSTCKHDGHNRPHHWLGHAYHSLPPHQDLQLLDVWFSFALASMSDTTLLVVLVTLTAAYHYIRIFSSWMDGSLFHLQVCRTRPSSSLA